MAGDEANRKKSNSFRVELQMEMEMTMIQDLNIYKSSSTSEPSSHIDSEADSEAADQEELNEYTYSPLNGDSDIENDMTNSSDESIALLVHEITCCESKTDTETDNDERDSEHGNATYEAKNSHGNDKDCINEITDNASDKMEVSQNIHPKHLPHNPYKLMANDEDEELNNPSDDDDDDASETLLLLAEDQESDNYDINLLKNELQKPDRDDNSNISRNN